MTPLTLIQDYIVFDACEAYLDAHDAFVLAEGTSVFARRELLAMQYDLEFQRSKILLASEIALKKDKADLFNQVNHINAQITLIRCALDGSRITLPTDDDETSESEATP